MSTIKRRQFIQFAGATLASLGLSHLDIQRQSFRYAKVLAQSTPRKLALLVGINNYASPYGLQGCLTDVDLQRELLVNRFNFNPKDIITLTDAQASRQGILAAFEEHLIKQAKPGDVVVYHFSGHGSRVADPDSNAPDKFNSTFVPVDTTEAIVDGKKTVSDIMGHTLFLLMSAVNTDNLTVVLDSCHSGGGKRGNILVRSLPRVSAGDGSVSPSSLELEYQQQWLSRLKMSPETFKQLRSQGVAKGVVIASAARSQLAADTPFEGFSAGFFTYLMTQYLWQQTGSPPVVSAIANISRRTSIEQRAQEPELECRPECNIKTATDKRPFYFLNAPTPAAEAVVSEVNGKDFTCFLGGIDSANFLAQESIFAIVDNQEREQAKVKINSRQGLIGKGTLLSGNATALKVGALLQEQVRGIPNDLSLKIGLDPSLEPDFSQAQTKLKSISRIEPLPIQKGQAVDYILGRMTESDRDLQKNTSQVPAINSLGLFTPTKEKIVENSFGAAAETIEAGINRLQTKFKVLLAGKVLRSTLNPNTSKLNVNALIVPVGGRGGEISAATATKRGKPVSGTRGGEIIPSAIALSSGKVKSGSTIQIQLKNSESTDLYINVLAIDSEGEMTVLFPSDFKSATEASRVAAGQSLVVPRSDRDNFDFRVSGTSGNIEILILASLTPLRDALKGLQKIASDSGQKRGDMLPVSDPSEVITSLFDDFDRHTRGKIEVTRRNTTLVDSKQLAALSMTFEVVG